MTKCIFENFNGQPKVDILIEQDDSNLYVSKETTFRNLDVQILHSERGSTYFLDSNFEDLGTNIQYYEDKTL